MPDSYSSSDPRVARVAMVRRQIEARGVRDRNVLAAMRTVPRHEFVPQDEWVAAYSDRPLPIGWGGTISQPYIVAHMTALGQLKGGEIVLEIGTGSGYQAAVLAEIAARVYTVECVEPLVRGAARRLHRLRYTNVRTRFGDGAEGWPDAGPFDVIMVTAAPAQEVPPALLEQLTDGGRLVAPVGEGEQQLELIERCGNRWHRTPGIGVRFVPLVE